MFENTPSDRMQLVGLGELVPPASCMVCGNGNHTKGYVHLGVWFEYEGTMYLCSTCLVQAAELVGCREPGEAKVIEDLNTSLAETVAQKENELRIANERLSAYDKLLSGVTAPVFNDDGNSSVPEHPLGEQAADAVQSVTPTGESVSEESVKVKRRGDAARSEQRDITAAGTGPSL